jgi:hypothetical protein
MSSSAIHNILRSSTAHKHRYEKDWLGLQIEPALGTEPPFDPNNLVHDSILLVQRVGLSLDLITPVFRSKIHNWNEKPLMVTETDCQHPCVGQKVVVALGYTSEQARVRLYYHWRSELTADIIDLSWANIKTDVQTYMVREYLDELLLTKFPVERSSFGDFSANRKVFTDTSSEPHDVVDPWSTVQALVTKQRAIFNCDEFEWSKALQYYCQAYNELSTTIPVVGDDVPEKIQAHRELLLVRKGRCERFSVAFETAMASPLEQWPGWLLEAYEETLGNVPWSDASLITETSLRTHASRLYVLKGPETWPSPSPVPSPDETPTPYLVENRPTIETIEPATSCTDDEAEIVGF